MSLPAANWEQEGNVIRGKASFSAQLLSRVRGEHLRSMPEGTASTFTELHHPKQKW